MVLRNTQSPKVEVGLNLSGYINSSYSYSLDQPCYFKKHWHQQVITSLVLRQMLRATPDFLPCTRATECWRWGKVALSLWLFSCWLLMKAEGMPEVCGCWLIPWITFCVLCTYFTFTYLCTQHFFAIEYKFSDGGHDSWHMVDTS